MLTADEQANFLKVVAGNWYEPLFCLALLTGLRQGELCALTWDDIDFEAKKLSVNKTLIYSKNIGEKKTQATNAIPRKPKRVTAQFP